MKRPFGRSSALWGGALLLTLLLAACSTMNENLLPAALAPVGGDSVELETGVGTSVAGSFDFNSNERARYTVSVSVGADWLAITSGSKGNIKSGQTKTVAFLATCPDTSGTQSAEITVTPNSGEASAVVTVELTCTDPGDPPPPPPPPPPPASEFEITLVFSNTITNAQKAVFESAAARWSQLIVGDVPDVRLRKNRNACGAGDPRFSGTVDDVVIYATVEPIDGPSGILGSAGPCFIRSGSSLPAYGIMRFDSADVESLVNGAFESVILHEMGHVIGIGTIWDTLGLLDYDSFSCQASNAISFNGAGAVSEWQGGLRGSGDVPVENEFGPGTKCGHWDEATFGNELMTGFLGFSSSNPISRMTVASLDDLGYTVDLGAADAYQLPSGGALQSQGARIDFHAETLRPIGVVGEDGSLLNAD